MIGVLIKSEVVGVREGGGVGGGKGWRNGVLCDGCKGGGGVVSGGLDVEISGGGIKNEGLINVVCWVFVIFGVLRDRGGISRGGGKVVVESGGLGNSRGISGGEEDIEIMEGCVGIDGCDVIGFGILGGCIWIVFCMVINWNLGYVVIVEISLFIFGKMEKLIVEIYSEELF